MLKLITLNIERDKHLDRVIAFLIKQSPEVVLFQEILARDVPLIEKTTGMQAVFSPQNIYCENDLKLTIGIAAFIQNNLQLERHASTFYRGNASELPRIYAGDAHKMNRSIHILDIIKNNELYRVANTHFTWTPNAKPNADQILDLKKMLAILSHYPDTVLCGDFNAPRGTEIFDSLALQFQDNIPLTIETTLDPHYHCAGHLKLVIDGIFTPPKYKALNVSVIGGITDHCAIVANIEKINKCI